ncbi:MAG: MFS transporter, partial [Cyclobacteriaceae bacterium]|nr:MFS transporter [Cyclobacteriaceae bacterium]
MYDWANSVYSLVITAAIFPSYYQAYAVGPDGSDKVFFFGFKIINSVLYSYSLAFSFLVVAIILPLLSGIADYSGNKRLYMKIFMYLGAVSCAGLYFFEGTNIELGIIFSIMASIGYSGSLVFYDAFLPEIATKDKVDTISAKGYSLGYMGSILLLTINILCIFFYEDLGISSEKEAIKISFITVGIWWILFAQVPLLVLPKYVKKEKRRDNIIKKGYRELLVVWEEVIKERNIK